MANWQCLQCNYIYEEEGKTPVMELTDDYTCPECGTNKTWLIRMADEETGE